MREETAADSRTVTEEIRETETAEEETVREEMAADSRAATEEVRDAIQDVSLISRQLP